MDLDHATWHSFLAQSTKRVRIVMPYEPPEAPPGERRRGAATWESSDSAGGGDEEGETASEAACDGEGIKKTGKGGVAIRAFVGVPKRTKRKAHL